MKTSHKHNLLRSTDWEGEPTEVIDPISKVDKLLESAPPQNSYTRNEAGVVQAQIRWDKRELPDGSLLQISFNQNPAKNEISHRLMHVIDPDEGGYLSWHNYELDSQAYSFCRLLEVNQSSPKPPAELDRRNFTEEDEIQVLKLLILYENAAAS